jgi:hypothetical protein
MRRTLNGIGSGGTLPRELTEKCNLIDRLLNFRDSRMHTSVGSGDSVVREQLLCEYGSKQAEKALQIVAESSRCPDLLYTANAFVDTRFDSQDIFEHNGLIVGVCPAVRAAFIHLLLAKRHSSKSLPWKKWTRFVTAILS